MGNGITRFGTVLIMAAVLASVACTGAAQSAAGVGIGADVPVAVSEANRVEDQAARDAERSAEAERFPPWVASLGEPAAVFGRIVEKRLAEVEAGPEAVQWTYVPGRGVLYMVRIAVEQMQTVPGESEERATPTEADIAWENAKRAMQGKSPRKPDEAQRVAAAIGVVSKAIKEFAHRLPLSQGEEVRVALLAGGQAVCSSLGGAQMTVLKHAAGAARQRAAGAVQEIGGWESTGGAAISTPAGVDFTDTGPRPGGEEPPASSPADQWVIVTADGPLPKPGDAFAEDAEVLARVLAKRLYSTFPDEFWGKDRYGRAGAVAVIAGEWGPVIAINMTFPIDAAAKASTTGGDLWEETTAELRGEPRRERGGSVGGRRLIGLLSEALVDFASRVRGLETGQAVTVSVYGGQVVVLGGGSGGRNEAAPDTRAYLRYAQHLGEPGPASPNYVLQVSAEDLKAAADGRLSRDGLIEKIMVQQVQKISGNRSRARSE